MLCGIPCRVAANGIFTQNGIPCPSKLIAGYRRRPHLPRDWAHPVPHLPREQSPPRVTGGYCSLLSLRTTSSLGLGSPLPHLHRDRARPAPRPQLHRFSQRRRDKGPAFIRESAPRAVGAGGERLKDEIVGSTMLRSSSGELADSLGGPYHLAGVSLALLDADRASCDLVSKRRLQASTTH
jgi:hypothetical protein